ncbi:hypothetical protein V6N13_134972 [Hibiscus sabdariffa]
MWSIDLAKGDLKHFRAVDFRELGFINKNILVLVLLEMKDDLEALITEPIASEFGTIKDKSCEAAMRGGDASASTHLSLTLSDSVTLERETEYQQEKAPSRSPRSSRAPAAALVMKFRHRGEVLLSDELLVSRACLCFQNAVVKTVDLEFLLTRFSTRRHSSRSSNSSRKRASRTKKVDPEQPVMENEKDAFFVVRKGDVVGVFKSFAECQAQIGSSICDPPVSVYKGSSLAKETEKYMSSRGLTNALYTIKAADVKEDLFRALIPCTFQEPASSKCETSHNDETKKRPHDMLQSEYGVLGSLGLPAVADPMRKHVKLEPHAEVQTASSGYLSCILEFDGASKGNPGPAGAAAVLKTDTGTVICKLREGLGVATNNAAEYRAVILGLKHALRKGYKNICVRGDSMIVCMQLQGLWKVKHEHMSELHAQAMELKNKFLSFQINHVLRVHLNSVKGSGKDLNGEADAEANLAVKLAGLSFSGANYITFKPQKTIWSLAFKLSSARNNGNAIFVFVCGRDMLNGVSNSKWHTFLALFNTIGMGGE